MGVEEQRELVTRLRAILADAIPRITSQEARFDQEMSFSQRARAAAYPIRWANLIRQVRRLAKRYGWEEEVEQALERAGAPALKYLEPHQLEQLLERLQALEDCIQTPCDPPDAPPAR